MKNDELNKLFERWKIEELYTNNSKGFAPDGINNEERYLNSGVTKVLFIAKEPNNENVPVEDRNLDFRIWWNRDTLPGIGRFGYRISEWSYGIHNDFPDFETISNIQKLDAIRNIAFMNVKKSGGGRNADLVSIMLYTCLHQKHIIEEINIIDPEIIVLGIGHELITKTIFKDNKLLWIDSGIKMLNQKTNIHIGKYNSIKLIDFYHPSAYVTAKDSYNLLRDIMHSDKFKQL